MPTFARDGARGIAHMLGQLSYVSMLLELTSMETSEWNSGSEADVSTRGAHPGRCDGERRAGDGVDATHQPPSRLALRAV